MSDTTDREASLLAREAALAEREAALDAREVELKAREDALASSSAAEPNLSSEPTAQEFAAVSEERLADPETQIAPEVASASEDKVTETEARAAPESAPVSDVIEKEPVVEEKEPTVGSEDKTVADEPVQNAVNVEESTLPVEETQEVPVVEYAPLSDPSAISEPEVKAADPISTEEQSAPDPLIAEIRAAQAPIVEEEAAQESFVETKEPEASSTIPEEPIVESLDSKTVSFSEPPAEGLSTAEPVQAETQQLEETPAILAARQDLKDEVVQDEAPVTVVKDVDTGENFTEPAAAAEPVVAEQRIDEGVSLPADNEVEKLIERTEKLAVDAPISAVGEDKVPGEEAKGPVAV